MGDSLAEREVLDLNGWWHAWFDSAADWRREVPLLPRTPLAQIPRRPPTVGWAGMDDGKESLPVPGTWASSHSGYHGVAWHWRPIAIPEHWGGRVIRLHFAAARLRAEVYLDQELVGYDLEGHTPVEVALTGRVRPGRVHVLAVRVTNPGGWTSPESQAPIRWGDRELPPGPDLGGLWGDVSLIATAPLYISRAWVAELSPCGARLQVELANHGPERTATISAQLLRQEGSLAAEVSPRPLTIAQNSRRLVSLPLSVASARPWSPGDPYRYMASISLRGKNLSDRVQFGLGLRSFNLLRDGLSWNGELLALRPRLALGSLPQRLSLPDPEQAVQEVAMARSLGVNALLLQEPCATPSVLEAADRLGVLVLQRGGESGSAAGVVAASRAFYQALVAQRTARIRLRDGRHPSLVWLTGVERAWLDSLWPAPSVA